MALSPIKEVDSSKKNEEQTIGKGMKNLRIREMMSTAMSLNREYENNSRDVQGRQNRSNDSIITSTLKSALRPKKYKSPEPQPSNIIVVQKKASNVRKA